LAQRVAGLTVTLVEIDAALAVLAKGNAERNGLSDRVAVAVLDIAGTDQDFANAGIGAGTATRVLMNPPFNDPARQNLSPDPQRRLAHAAPKTTLEGWMRRAASLLAPAGTLTLIWRADGMADVLAAASGDFGGIAVLPVYPRPGAAAIRVLVRAVKGSRAPLALGSGLTLNDAQGRSSAAAEAILRGAAPIRWPGD
jgi:tRNA1(Val) A37 N6-methylase TrmN6